MKTPFRKSRRVLGLMFYAAVVSWLAYITIDRWKGVPNVPGAIPAIGASSGRSIDSALDRTQTLIAALNAIPPMPQIVVPPQTRIQLLLVFDQVDRRQKQDGHDSHEPFAPVY